MTVVVATAGHIDHGKTALLRALTGIDADRLPEEQRRGMTIDVGFAHAVLPDGETLDFVDVPGHDRLIGNMLVGAGEVDAALVVVAIDDGPRAQTIEHLELLDGLGIADGIAAITKVDLSGPDDTWRAIVRDELRDLLDRTTMAGAPIVEVSSVTGEGLDQLRADLVALRDRVRSRPGFGGGPTRLAIDRAFGVRGRGVVVTGSLRGGSIARGATLRLDPGGRDVRIREVQVHGKPVDRVDRPGRVALNVAGIELGEVSRGQVLSDGPAVETTDRLLVSLRPTVVLRGGASVDRRLRPGLPLRLHLGTDEVDGTLDVGRRASVALEDGRITAVLRLDRAVATAFGDRFVLRRPSPGETLAGGLVLDPRPPRGVSRRRVTSESLVRTATAAPEAAGWLAALVALHGALPSLRADALLAAAPRARSGDIDDALARRAGGVLLEAAIADALDATAVELAAGPGGAAGSMGLPLAELRTTLVTALRRRATIDRGAASNAVDALIAASIAAGRLVREGDRVLPPGRAGGRSPEIEAAMSRLETALAVPSPPSLSEAASSAGCPADAVRVLESAGRITRLEDDLAWATPTLRGFEDLAVRLASSGPLAPSTFRDAAGTSRRYALAILEDLDRRGVLRRTPEGHVPGPRAATLATPG